jgi:LuxR family transcriptional regulator of csgAB operon
VGFRSKDWGKHFPMPRPFFLTFLNKTDPVKSETYRYRCLIAIGRLAYFLLEVWHGFVYISSTRSNFYWIEPAGSEVGNHSVETATTMTASAAKSQKPAAAPIVCIIGPNLFQNELFAHFIRQTTDLECRCECFPLEDALNAGPGRSLVLIDCANNRYSDDTVGLLARLRVAGGRATVAFFNVHPDRKFEKEVVLQGVKGIFFHSDPLELIAKGIQALVAGEAWFSRKIVADLVQKACLYVKPKHPAVELLTGREKEILLEIASGAGNQEIAEKLNLSLHTIKTHIYRTYKKIDVNNRLQATLWVAAYL